MFFIRFSSFFFFLTKHIITLLSVRYSLIYLKSHLACVQAFCLLFLSLSNPFYLLLIGFMLNRDLFLFYIQGHITQGFSKMHKNIVCYNLSYIYLITANFCTWADSTAVGPYAKFCDDLTLMHYAKSTCFHIIWNLYMLCETSSHNICKYSS